jgi:ADP-L-glycero-D-manno-heptose 6-epimerase
LIVVTGGAGFIGSNLIKALNAAGREDIVLVDEPGDGSKSVNIDDSVITKFRDKDEWLSVIEANNTPAGEVECVFHLGACSDTTETNRQFMMDTNFRYSRSVFDYCARNRIPLVYASSAAVYGNGRVFEEKPRCERPLNVYGESKLAFDQYVRQRLNDIDSLVVGLRYFNVYGPREQHKGRMASVAWHLHMQMQSDEKLRLFSASHGYGDGEQRRDFVHVDDAVHVTLWWAAQDSSKSGIYNCGTGRAETFNAVANAVIAWYGKGSIEYVEFPPELQSAYQPYTQADVSRLRAGGYTRDFRPVAEGVREYLNWLTS